jgi:hypothetical protein
VFCRNKFSGYRISSGKSKIFLWVILFLTPIYLYAYSNRVRVSLIGYVPKTLYMIYIWCQLDGILPSSCPRISYELHGITRILVFDHTLYTPLGISLMLCMYFVYIYVPIYNKLSTFWPPTCVIANRNQQWWMSGVPKN